ncbi:NAC domain containing protein 89 [Actinidia rufa]|uniref:NAC domain containing protein 89 n=1 Tax=Actinidia rufa TaxID=165716 RepID=A0A7J0G931_9ERIC|nr:NAC domain containing protein 89 [Actinidia rufa]
MDEKLSQTQISISAPSMFPGFRFSPTDGELISYYLKKKLEGSEKCVEVISVVEICKYEPWDLPAKSVVQSENEWFFFSPRGRTYPHGLQRKRATESGYWKATGKERNDSLVVCRLRKNTEFRLNDSPRQGSSSLRPLSTEDSINFTLSEVAVEQLGLLEGAKAVESCSKECSSSHNSHSVEQQIDESESNLKLAIELSQLCSSSCRGFDDEECYAEILKDDIVDLGKTLLPPTPDLLLMFPEKTEDERCCQQPEQAIPSHVLPLQGKANRRIRLRWLKDHHKFHFKPVEVSARNNSSFVKEFVRPNSDQPPNSILGLLSSQRVNRRSAFVVLVVLTLLVLFVSMLGVP